MEPAPPPITIVDPNAPPGEQDVLGSDGGWRASPYQRLVAGLMALIVALLVGGVQRVRQVHHDEALDQAAIDDVAFTINDPAAYSDYDISQSTSVDLVNSGTKPVLVTGLALVGDGFREQPHHERLDPSTTATLALSDAKNCRTSMYTTEPAELRVRARTTRGDEVTRVVPLPAVLASGIGFRERVECGYLRPDEALQSRVLGVARQGNDVVVTVELVNTGVEPLTLSNPVSPPGVTITMPSVDLPRRRFWTGGSKPQRVAVRMHVTDCEKLALALTSSFGPGTSLHGLQVFAKNPYVEASAYVDLASYSGGFPSSVLDSVALLRKTCPELPVTPVLQY